MYMGIVMNVSRLCNIFKEVSNSTEEMVSARLIAGSVGRDCLTK